MKETLDQALGRAIKEKHPYLFPEVKPISPSRRIKWTEEKRAFLAKAIENIGKSQV